jgi:hypothetical protein
LPLREMLLPTMADIRRYMAMPAELRRESDLGGPNDRL